MKLTLFSILALAGTMLLPSSVTAEDAAKAEKARQRLARQVRQELVTLPNYGVFDNLEFKVERGTVTLLGQVRSLGLKTAAENVVREVEGVERVDNRIEVLPASPADDQIRLAIANRLYGQPTLQRYSLQAVPPIHIIVKNGAVTLTGVVLHQLDKALAVSLAKAVPGTFGVTDALRVETQ